MKKKVFNPFWDKKISIGNLLGAKLYELKGERFEQLDIIKENIIEEFIDSKKVYDYTRFDSEDKGALGIFKFRSYTFMDKYVKNTWKGKIKLNDFYNILSSKNKEYLLRMFLRDINGIYCCKKIENLIFSDYIDIVINNEDTIIAIWKKSEDYNTGKLLFCPYCGGDLIDMPFKTLANYIINDNESLVDLDLIDLMT